MEPQNQNPAQPNNQPTAPVPTQSVAQPTPSPQPVQQPQSASSMGLNQASKPKSPWRKRIIRTLVGLLLLILVVVLISFVSVFYRLPNTSYDNGQGQKFSLRFYRNATTESACSVPGYSEPACNDGADVLIAGPAEDYPMLISIRKTDGPELYQKEQLCDYPPLTVVRASSKNKVCTFGSALSERQYMYFYEFTENSNTYLVTMHIVAPEQALQLSAPANATDEEVEDLANNSEAYTRSDLRPYNDDLRIILESIKVE